MFEFLLASLLSVGHDRSSLSPNPRPEGTPVVTIARTPRLEPIPEVFTEPYGGGSGFRFKIRRVKINNQGKVVTVTKGGELPVTMEMLHDCESCGNAVNQVIVGLGGEKRAQLSVWNGKQRSGGPALVVNPGTSLAAPAEDNPGPAEWVKVYFTIRVPNRPGVYYLRARYAQDYQGNLLTREGLQSPQPPFEKVLGWWTVDRPSGPTSASNIGAIIVR